MKYAGKVIEAVTDADGVDIVVECKQKGAASWRRPDRVEFTVRPHEAAHFPIGRKVNISVKPT